MGVRSNSAGGVDWRAALAVMMLVLSLLTGASSPPMGAEDGLTSTPPTRVHPSLSSQQLTGSYAANASTDLPLGTFGYQPEELWTLALDYDEQRLFDPVEGLVLGDFDGDGDTEVCTWSQFSLDIVDGWRGTVVRRSHAVPWSEAELDEPGFLYLGSGLARTVASEGDEGDHLLLVGEPTGSGSEPGFRMRRYDVWDNETVWTQTVGGRPPEAILVEDLDGDGSADILFMVKGVKSDDYTCLDSRTGRVKWRASHYLDWDNVPLAFTPDATGSGDPEVFVGARFRWRPGGSIGDVEVRFLNVATTTFNELLISYGGYQPKAFSLANVWGDGRPELLMFLDDQVYYYDLDGQQRRGIIPYGRKVTHSLVPWAVGDLDNDGIEEVAMSEVGPAEEGGADTVLRTGLVQPAQGIVSFAPERETSPDHQDNPLLPQLELFRGIPWGGAVMLQGLAVEGYEGREAGRTWELDLSEVVTVEPERTGLAMADLDGNGELDLLVAVVKRNVGAWLGAYKPGEPRVRVLSANPEMRTCFATHEDYEFSFDVVPTSGTGHILSYSMIVPSEETPLASWKQRSGFSNPLGDWVQLGEGSGYSGLPGGGSRVTFALNFTWLCDLEEFQDVILRIEFEGDVEEDHPFGRLFRVENDLQALGSLHATTEGGRRVDDGGWVAADVPISVGGVRVAYEGHPEVFPPSVGGHLEWREGTLVFNKSLVLDRGQEDHVNVQVIEGVQLGEMVFYLTVETGSPSSTPVRETLRVQVDGLPPVGFQVYTVSPGYWATPNVRVAFVLVDDESGPDEDRLQYCVRPEGETQFGPWQNATDYSTSREGNTVTFVLSLEMPPGSHQVRFRGWDLVGNRPTASTPLAVDVWNSSLVYSDFSPGDWTMEWPVEVSVRLTSKGPLVMDGDSLRYRLMVGETDLTSEWITLPLGETGQDLHPSVMLDVPSGSKTYVQFRVDDTLERGPYHSRIYRLLVDREGPEFGQGSPGPGELQTGRSVDFTTHIYDDGSGVDLDRVSLAVWHEGEEVVFHPVEGLRGDGEVEVTAPVELRNGRDNYVRLSAWDRVGNGPVESAVYVLWADLEGIVFSNFTPLPDQVADGPLVNVSVNVSDGGGSGVDLATLEYSVRVQGSNTWGPWSPVGLWGEADVVRVNATLNLTGGTTNHVRFRGQDVLGTGVVWSDEYEVTVNGPPTVVFQEPVRWTFDAGEEVLFRVSAFDPENDTLALSWWLDDETFLGSGDSMAMEVPAGDHVVTVWADDGHGNNVSHSKLFKAEDRNAGAEVGPVHWAVTAAVFLAALAAGWYLEGARLERRKRDG